MKRSATSGEDDELRRRPEHVAWVLPPLDESQPDPGGEADERVVTPAKSRRRETR